MWVPSVAMMLSSLLSYVDRQVLAVLSPMILHDTGLSAQAYANALSAFSIFYMIGNPLFGSFLDFIGLRKGMFAAVSLRAHLDKLEDEHRLPADVELPYW